MNNVNNASNSNYSYMTSADFSNISSSPTRAELREKSKIEWQAWEKQNQSIAPRPQVKKELYRDIYSTSEDFSKHANNPTRAQLREEASTEWEAWEKQQNQLTTQRAQVETEIYIPESNK